VTLLLARAYVNGKAIVHISNDASDAGIAAIGRPLFLRRSDARYGDDAIGRAVIN
jgi:hypothetical protein